VAWGGLWDKVQDVTLSDLTQLCRNHGSLGRAEAAAAMEGLLEPEEDEAAKLDFLRALTDKGERAGELAALVEAILPRAVDPGFHGHWGGQRILDCCGTGGGGFNLFNVSTGIMFILAACGVPVAKHGNRGITKKSGSADVLAALGLPIAATPAQLRRQMEANGVTFIAAPQFHPAFRALAPLRQKLAAEGRRTVFNLLGPLLNPCRPAAQLIGVFQPQHVTLFSDALEALGRERHAVVYGEAPDGRAIGEAGIFRRNRVRWRKDGPPEDYEETFRGAVPDLEGLMVDGPAVSAEILERLLRGEEVGCGQALLIHNAALALHIYGRSDFQAAEREAEEALASGRAYAKLQAWRALPLE
jgi:anthranilate phosphoribosyltransferase